MESIKLNKKLPRGYLSHSSISLWERDPQKFIKKYVYGEDDETNIYIDLGKRVALALEGGKSPDQGIDLLITALPAYPKREFELYGVLKDKHEDIPLLAKFDGYSPTMLILGEIKTGQKYTQKIADENSQLKFYNMLHYLVKKRMFNKIFLHWAETKLTGNKLNITGKFQTFEVKHSYAEIVKEMIKVKKIYKEISEAYAKELKKI